MEHIENLFLTGTAAVLVFFNLFVLLRALIGPTRADRIMGINLIGTLSTTLIAVLSVLFLEDWLLDVCLIYCLISFLAVVVLTKIHISEKEAQDE